MKTMFFSLAIFTLCISGCSSSPVAMNYSPSSLLTTSGNINVGNFLYNPFINKKVEENEIKTTAVGHFKIDSTISNLITNAVKLEFKFMGTKLDNSSNKILTGEINEFLFDDLGFSVDVTLAIKYILKTKDAVCITKEIITKKSGAKFVNPTGLASETIKNNIESLAKDSSFLSCLNQF